MLSYVGYPGPVVYNTAQATEGMLTPNALSKAIFTRVNGNWGGSGESVAVLKI